MSIKVIVGMSGGVDSSTAALLLKQQGYQVHGIFMQNWDDQDEHCTARQDYRDAAAVCKHLNIPLETVNFAREYWDRVFAHFLEEYSAGRTPNPDILCNKEIKFKAFLDYALAKGCDAIATGHYARTGKDANGVTLMRGLDNNKDQSYFLYTLGQRELSHTLFPVGDQDKQDVRELAQDCGLHVFSKKDSTGICFIGERKFNAFLAEYLPARPGHIVDLDGTHMGRHSGLMYYTMGQRQGLGIGGRQDASEEPWYVVEKRLDSNEVVVAQGHDHPLLYSDTLQAHSLHWCAGSATAQQFHCSAKIRYRQQDQACTVTINGDDALSVHFDQPVRAITPGQSVVFYDGENCLGGAVIQATSDSENPMSARQAV